MCLALSTTGGFGVKTKFFEQFELITDYWHFFTVIKHISTIILASDYRQSLWNPQINISKYFMDFVSPEQVFGTDMP